MVPSAQCGLNETSPFSSGYEIAGDDQRIAEDGRTVFGMVGSGKAEYSVDIRRIHERFRLRIEIVHVERRFAEETAGAVRVERLQERPAIGKARRAVGMRNCGETGCRRYNLKRRVLRRKITGRRNAR